MLLILFPTFILIQFLLGYEFQIKAFTLVAPLLTIFTLISYYVVYTRIKDNFSSYFVAGSLIYLLLANISFLEIFIGIKFIPLKVMFSSKT